GSSLNVMILRGRRGASPFAVTATVPSMSCEIRRDVRRELRADPRSPHLPRRAEIKAWSAAVIDEAAGVFGICVSPHFVPLLHRLFCRLLVGWFRHDALAPFQIGRAS